jgi:hypothetical protein
MSFRKAMIRAALLGPLAISATGCPSFIEAPGAQFTPKKALEGQAVVYFYRPAKRIMGDYPVFMSIPYEADNCFKMESGGYTVHFAAPGKLRVAGAMTGWAEYNTELKAGDERWVRVEFNDDEKPAMTEVAASVGRSEVRENREIETCSDKVSEKKESN